MSGKGGPLGNVTFSKSNKSDTKAGSKRVKTSLGKRDGFLNKQLRLTF